jgi:hypothetical protein
MPLALQRISREARRLLREKGIRKLDKVPVRLNSEAVNSWCLVKPIKIEIGWPVAVVALIDPGRCVRLLVHEYGHAVLFQLWPKLNRSQRNRWKVTFGDYETDPDVDPYPTNFNRLKALITGSNKTYNTKRYVSQYATVSAHEDWAETLTGFVFDEINNTRQLARKVACIEYFIRLHQCAVTQ